MERNEKKEARLKEKQAAPKRKRPGIDSGALNKDQSNNF
jgi:hypothetical protein